MCENSRRRCCIFFDRVLCLNKRRRNGPRESKRVKDFAEEFGPENLIILLGAGEAEASGLAAETVTAGDPTFAGPLTGVQLGLQVYHVCEEEMKQEFDDAVYEEQISMMEMVLDLDEIAAEMQSIREQYSKF